MKDVLITGLTFRASTIYPPPFFLPVATSKCCYFASVFKKCTRSLILHVASNLYLRRDPERKNRFAEPLEEKDPGPIGRTAIQYLLIM